MNRRHSQDNTPKSRYFLLGLTIFLAGAALIGMYYVLFHSSKLANIFHFITDMLMPIVYGFVLAYVLIPALNFFETKAVVPVARKLKVDIKAKRNGIRAISVTITACVSILVIYLFVYMFVSQIIPSIQDIIDNFDTYVNNGVAYVNKIFEDNPNFRDFFNNMINKYSVELEFWLNNTLFPKLSTILMSVSLSVINVLGFLWDFILGFILSIYILHSKDVFAEQAKKISYGLFSTETANGLLQDVRFVHKTFTGFITGKVIDSFIIGVLCFIGTSILGTPYAALASVIIGVTNVIPFFGPFLGAIPCSVLIFVVAPMQPLHTVYFVIFILLLQQFDGNILGPKILGDSTGLGSFWVIFAITIFGGLLGVPGMIIGVPTFAVIFAMIRRYINKRLTQKGLSVDRADYSNMECVDEDNHIIAKNPVEKESVEQSIITE